MRGHGEMGSAGDRTEAESCHRRLRPPFSGIGVPSSTCFGWHSVQNHFEFFGACFIPRHARWNCKKGSDVK